MNKTRTGVHHHRPPRSARTLVNAFVTTVLRSPWHGLRSGHLLLITFTGRKSGREFTTPVRYVQDGESLLIKVVVEYRWWKNLVGGANVRILLRGKMRTGTAEVLPEEDRLVPVKIHLTS